MPYSKKRRENDPRFGELVKARNREKTARYREKNPSSWHTWKNADPERYFQKLLKQSLRVDRLRLQVLEMLGGLNCVTCGYDANPRALQIDHINGDGYLDSKKSRNAVYYSKILNDPSARLRYQVLCANCNQIKKFENNEHNQITRRFNERKSLAPG